MMSSDEAGREPEHGTRGFEASLSALMSGLNHDLKNPLGAADGYLELLAGGVMGELTEQQLGAIGNARRLIDSAIGIVDGVVTYARAHMGELPVHTTPVDVASLVRLTVSETKTPEDGPTLAVETEDGLPEIVTDSDRVGAIVRQLIANAASHGGAGTRVDVKVRARDDGPGVAVAVTDDGPGIPEDSQARIFDVFEKLDGGSNQGVGFGLPLSRALAQLLGGTLSVESEPGRGSTFTLRLPPESAPR